MKNRLLLTLTALGGLLILSAEAQTTLPVNVGQSGRIMSSNGPAHLGGGNISGVIGLNDTGDSIVGDNSGNSFNFSLTLAFDTSAAFRTAVANGGTVTLTGSTLFGVDDGFGGIIPKSTGNVNWGGGVKASVNAYGNSLVGTYSDDNNFSRHAAFNLTDADSANGVAAYGLGGALGYSGNPYAVDTTFTVDLTGLIAALPLDVTLDRIYIGLSAWAPDLSQIWSADGIADRVAFVGSSFELTAVPEPSTYAAIFGFLALAGVMIRRRMKK